jgi:hypothetical protein
MSIVFVVSIILVVLSIVAWRFHVSRHAGLEWSFRLDRATELNQGSIIGPPISVQIGGTVPKRVYIQDSVELVLSASPAFKPDYQLGEVIVRPGTTIQVQLLAAEEAALDVGGDPIQQKVITIGKSDINFRWVISPKKSGRHKLILIVEWLDEHDIPHEVDSRTFSVQVTQHFGLSNSQYNVINLVVGLIGVLGVIFGICGFFKP